MLLFQVRDVHVGVDLRGGDGFVAQLLLDVAQGGFALQHVGGAGVAEQVRVDVVCDAGLPSVVLHDLLHAQTGGAVSQEAIGWYGGIILSIFLVGWAVGGVLFGIVADRFGRTKTLVFTILIYALFTGLAALSATWWQLALYRFLTALGIGGEWAAGAALVAEVWPEQKRAKAAGAGG